MTKNKTKRLLLAAALIASVFIFGVNIAYGIAQITLTVKNPNPYEGNYSWFVYTKNPGDTIEDIATVKNFSEEPAQVSVYAVDAMSSESGSFILSFPQDEQSGIGEWTEVESKSLTIPPYEVVDIPFSIKIPQDAPPGQYIGGIVVENGIGETQDEFTEEGDINAPNIAVKTRVGARVYLTIPGEIVEDMDFSSFSARKELTGATKFFLTLENRGNISYEPSVHIDVYTQTGRLYESIDKSLGTISPDSVIKPVVLMEKRPIFGNFTAKATVTFRCRFAPENLHGSAHYLDKETSFWAVPWEIIISSLLLVSVVFIIITNRSLARKKYFTTGEEYTVQVNQNLVSIGESRKIPWKKIAKYNKLKPPYILKPGDKIIVPKKENEK